VSIDYDAERLRLLGERLRAVGTEGQGLRRELMKAVTEAAKPLAREIADVEHLKPYMPDRYAAVLAADLNVSSQKILSRNPQISVRARGRQHKRKVEWLNQGNINHPVYARGPRKTWRWENRQVKGMRRGFFDDAVGDVAPELRAQVMKALEEVYRQVTD